MRKSTSLDSGTQELAMGSVTKKRLFIGILLCVLIAVIILHIFPTKSQLITTPSTHQSIAYLPMESYFLAPDVWVKFAAFDVAANTVQITLATIKSPVDSRQVLPNLAITVDSAKLNRYNVIFDKSLKCTYIHILIQDVGLSFEEIGITYNNNTVTIGK